MKIKGNLNVQIINSKIQATPILRTKIQSLVLRIILHILRGNNMNLSMYIVVIYPIKLPTSLSKNLTMLSDSMGSL